MPLKNFLKIVNEHDAALSEVAALKERLEVAGRNLADSDEYNLRTCELITATRDRMITAERRLIVVRRNLRELDRIACNIAHRDTRVLRAVIKNALVLTGDDRNQ